MAEDVEARFRRLLEQKTELIRRLEAEKRELVDQVATLEAEVGRLDRLLLVASGTGSPAPRMVVAS